MVTKEYCILCNENYENKTKKVDVPTLFQYTFPCCTSHLAFCELNPNFCKIEVYKNIKSTKQKSCAKNQTFVKHLSYNN